MNIHQINYKRIVPEQTKGRRALIVMVSKQSYAGIISDLSNYIFQISK